MLPTAVNLFKSLGVVPEEVGVLPNLVAEYEEVAATGRFDIGIQASVAVSGSSSGVLEGDVSAEGIGEIAHEVAGSCLHRFDPE